MDRPQTENIDEIGVRRLSDLIDSASSIVFFTGAGVSTESGIADFRSPGGIWSIMKPIEFDDFLANEDARLEDWSRRFRFQAEFDAAAPNGGHDVAAKITNGPKGLGIITQNIDGLHQRAGVANEKIIEIHGNGTRAACLDCDRAMTLEEARQIIAETGKSPRCGACGGLVKSNIISFGQPMPRIPMERAKSLSVACDLMIVLGSSLVVQPAASLPVIAARSGARLAIVNREKTPLDGLADVVIGGSISTTLLHVLHTC